NQRAKFKLHVLVRREFIFELGFARPVASVGFSKPRDALPRKFLFAFEADARPFRETENVFGLDVTIDSRVVVPGVLGTSYKGARDEKWCRKDHRASIAKTMHCTFPCTPVHRPTSGPRHPCTTKRSPKNSGVNINRQDIRTLPVRRRSKLNTRLCF